MLVKNLSIIYLIIIIMSCNAKDNVNKVHITNEKYMMKSRDTFNIVALDSIIEIISEEKLITKSVENKDSIQLYTGLLNAFNTTGIIGITYKYPTSKKAKIKKALLPGKINQLIFDNAQNAKKSFSLFSGELLNNKLKGKVIIKSGGICFINDNVIYLLPVSTCENNKNINMIEGVLKNNVFKSSFDGIKMYCSLERVEKIIYTP